MTVHIPPSIATDGRYRRVPDDLFPGHIPDFWHLDGIVWWDAPLPRRWHRCRVQSAAWTDDWTGLGKAELHRCACGAIRILDGRPYSGWLWRNERRKQHTR